MVKEFPGLNSGTKFKKYLRALSRSSVHLLITLATASSLESYRCCANPTAICFRSVLHSTNLREHN